MGKTDTVAAIQDLIERVKRGEVTCAALRLFKPDGTWEDIVIGGTDPERAEALAALLKLDD